MARNGLNFETAIAPGPSTTQSMPAVFTGSYPVKRDVSADSSLEARRAFFRPHMNARDTLPQRLSRAGYATAGFTPNPYTSRFLGFEQGFDHFEDFIGRSRSSLYDYLFKGFSKNDSALAMARMGINAIQREEVFKPWEAYYDEITSWLATAEEPYFLWVHLMDPHFPFLVDSSYRTQSFLDMYRGNWEFWNTIRNDEALDPAARDRVITAYDDSIRYTDDFLERIKADTADDDPLLIVHGDHGEAFGEHDDYGHGSGLYQEHVHVPFVVSGATDKDIQTPVSLELLPDLIDQLRSGRSVEGALKPYAFAQTLDCSLVAVVSDSWKYIRNDDSSELYDLTQGEENTIENSEYHEQGQALVDARIAKYRERLRIAKVAPSISDAS
jgi:arylsulfatase